MFYYREAAVLELSPATADMSGVLPDQLGVVPHSDTALAPGPAVRQLATVSQSREQ